MKHAYWVVSCKTRKCGIIVAKYIGEHDGRPIYTLPSKMPAWFHFQCGTCEKAHRYKRVDLQASVLDFAPPADFQAWW